jgi:hypothetical protein
MIRKTVATLSLLAGFAIAGNAIAQTTALPILGFKLGDDVATVKTALKTNTDVEPIGRNPLLPPTAIDINKGKTVLHLRTKGIWVFFDPAGAVENIRLDAPFSGSVLGVKLGDSEKQLLTKLGNPIKKPGTAFFTMQSHQYVLDDSAYVNFVTNDDGIQMIFITR